jgi:ABC-2 type transport system permease protein
MPQKEIVMNNIKLIAKKEWMDIFRSKTFLYILVLLVALTITSLTVSFLVFNSQVKEYETALNILKQLGREPTTPPPKLYPLSLLRGVVDYIEIIGAILGIILGYISISKERNTKALKLLLTRPITKREIAYGKIAGNGLFVLVLMSIVSVIIFLIIYLIGGVVLDSIDLLKLFLFVLFSTIYIMLFFMISFFFSLQQKTIAHALIISFIIWLVIVLILPQIGDTMDPDNQVPGGFFKSMSLNKTQEKQVLSEFSGYENIRGFIEELSITKNYERLIFAIFGIKDTYRDEPLLNVMFENMNNVIWIAVFALIGFFADYLLLLKNKNYLGDRQ